MIIELEEWKYKQRQRTSDSPVTRDLSPPLEADGFMLRIRPKAEVVASESVGFSVSKDSGYILPSEVGRLGG